MAEIVPAIIAKDFDDLKNKVKLVEPCVKTVQLDIMDGIFVLNKTWPFAASTAQGKPSLRDLDTLETGLFLEAHLMVVEPEKTASEWAASPVKRIIFHWEALGDFKSQISNIAQVVYGSGKQLGVALNPETPLEVLDHFVGKIDFVLLMSVNPGSAGQKMIENVIHKVAALRQKYPDVKIEVDGGINFENAKRLAQAGADFLAVGSTIFESENNIETINKLKQTLATD